MITVEVTAEDIAAGRRFDCSSCPLALAFHRIRGFKCADVTAYRVYRSPLASIALPEIAHQFVCRFDHGLSVEPFSFTLEVPLPA